MATLPALLRKHKDLYRRYIELEHEIAVVEKQITEVGNSAIKPPRKRSTKHELVEGVRQTIKVLRDANEPLPRREIAARLGVPTRTVNYRLSTAIKLRFVERVGYGRYQVTNVVPAF